MASIAENLQKLSASLEAAYEAIEQRGGTVPEKRCASNLSAAIGSIQGGGSKYGATLSTFLGEVDSAGTYQRPTSDVTLNYAGVKNVGSYAMAYQFARYSGDTTKKRNIHVKFQDLTTLTNSYALYYYGYYNRDIVDADFPELTSTTGSYALDHAFYSCANLTSINMPKLKTVGSYGLQYAFSSCSGLKDVSYPSLTAITGSYGLGYAHQSNTSLSSFCLSALQTVTGTYGLYYAFSSCTKLSTAEYPALTSLANYGMYYTHNGNTALTSFSLSALKTVGSYGLNRTFYSCSKLPEASYPSLTGLTGTYGMAYCHYNNTSLTAVCLSALSAGATQNYVFQNAFYGCTTLPELNLSSLSGYAAGYSFNNVCYGCTSLTAANFDGLSAIGSGSSYTYCFASAFYNCSALVNVSFANVQSIAGNYAFSNAFYNCTSLTSLTFPELTAITGATSTSYATFYNCNKIKELFFPKLSAITNTYVFYTNCTDLTTLHFAKVNEAAITATTGYSTHWGLGASKGTILFDLNTDGTVWSGVPGEEY